MLWSVVAGVDDSSDSRGADAGISVYSNCEAEGYGWSV